MKLHRFLLSSRSEYFRGKLENSWRDKELVSLTQQSDYDAFSVVVDYIYLHHDPKKFENVDNKLLLAYGKKIKLPQFVKIIEELIEIGNDSKAKAKLMNEFQMRMFESARDNFKKLVENGIIGQKVTIKSNDKIDEEQIKKFQNSNAYPDINKIDEEQIKKFQNSNAYPDIILSVEEVGETTYYPVHRSILIRDEYFKVMFSSSFSESQVYEVSEKYDIIDRSVTIPIIHLPVSSTAVAEIIIKFLYYDHADIPLEHAIDVLFAGDLLLNERLKTMAAVTLTTSDKIPEGYDLFDILRAGWETRVDRLEHYVARVIANDLDKFMKDPDFSSIVLEVSY